MPIIEDDVTDTETKTETVLDTLASIMACDGGTWDNLISMFSNTGIIQKGYYYLMSPSGRSLIVKATSDYIDSGRIPIFDANGQAYLADLAYKDWDTNEVVIGAAKFFDSENFDYETSVKELVLNTQAALLNSKIFRSGLQAVKAINPVETFDSLTATFKNNISGNVMETFAQVRSCLCAANASESLCLYFKNVYTNLNSGYNTTTNTWIAADKPEFYVQGFSGEVVFNTVMTIGSAIFSAVATAISPILGAVAGLISVIGNGIVKYFNSLTDTRLNYNASQGTLYAQPLFTYSGPAGPKVIDVLKNTLNASRCINMPRLLIQMSLIDDSNVSIVIYGKIVYNYFNVWYGSYDHESDFRACGGANISGKQQNMLNQQENDSVGPVASDAGDMILKFCIIQDIEYLINTFTNGYGGSWDPSISYSTSMSKESILGFIGRAYNIDTYRPAPWVVDSEITWENIVNYVIPSVTNAFSSEIITLFNQGEFLRFYDIDRRYYGGTLYCTRTISETSSKALIIDAQMSDNYISWTPPKYSKTAILAAIAGVATVAVIAIATSVVALKVKRSIQKKVQQKQLDIEAARYRYEASPTRANFDEYFNAMRKYNRTSWLFGQNKMSMYSLGEITGSTSSDQAYNELGTFTLQKLIRG